MTLWVWRLRLLQKKWIFLPSHWRARRCWPLTCVSQWFFSIVLECTRVDAIFVSVARNYRDLSSLELSPALHMFHYAVKSGMFVLRKLHQHRAGSGTDTPSARPLWEFERVVVVVNLDCRTGINFDCIQHAMHTVCICILFSTLTTKTWCVWRRVKQHHSTAPVPKFLDPPLSIITTTASDSTKTQVYIIIEKKITQDWGYMFHFDRYLLSDWLYTVFTSRSEISQLFTKNRHVKNAGKWLQIFGF